MLSELRKRIFTSFILLLLSIICIFANFYFFIIAIILTSFLAWRETNFLIYSITKTFNNDRYYVFSLISLLYIVFIFALSCIGLYLLLGPLFFLYTLSICICSDVGGYIVGKKIGGKKLTKISLNKTISGSIGSLIFSILPLLIINYFHKSDQFLYSFDNFLFCFEVSLVCQLGDLFISYLKRKGKVKDTGKMLPGHGGVLDRIDGIIFAIPFAFFLLNDFINFLKNI